MKFVQSTKTFLKFFDLYGQNINLFISKKPKFYSACSGLISLFVIFVIIYAFTQFILAWLNGEKMTVISSSKVYSITELLQKDMTFSYDLDYNNYYIYFVIMATLPDGTLLLTQDLTSYVSYNFTYITNELTTVGLRDGPCSNQYNDIFLGMDQATIDSDAGTFKKNRICISDTFEMGIYPDQNNNNINQTEFYFSVYPCVNSTENNNSCASQDEINSMIEIIQVQLSIPTTIYDFQNTQKPQTTFYNYQNIQLELDMVKWFQNNMIPSLLYTDYGLVTEDYRLMDTKFNPDIFYDPRIRKASDPLLVFDCILNFNFQMYYQRNQKINDIAGSLGGLLNSIFLIGKLICLTYNSIYLRFKIIKTTFSNSAQRESRIKQIFPKFTDKRSSTLGKSKVPNSFSYFKYLFPTKEVRLFYQRGSSKLHEYLDIRNIIKRLQDLDKLKMILLNENQRKLFELIPKPDVVNTNNKNSLHTLLEYKNSKKNSIATNLPNMKSFADENNPINQRIIEFLGENLKARDDLENSEKKEVEMSSVDKKSDETPNLKVVKKNAKTFKFSSGNDKCFE